MNDTVQKWKEEDLQFLLDPKFFPECIECGNLYFHKSHCSRITGKMSDATWKRVNEKLDARLKEFNEKFKKDNKGVRTGLKCKHCSNPATGKIVVMFHNSTSVIEEWFVCMDHAFHEESNGRKAEYRGL